MKHALRWTLGFTLLSAWFLGPSACAQEPEEPVAVEAENDPAGDELLQEAPSKTAKGRAAKKPEGWKSELSIGVDLYRGNTDSQRTKGQLAAKNKTEYTRWDLGAEATYAETDEEKSAERARAWLQYDQDISDWQYGSLRISVDYDALAALDYRLLFGPALGFVLRRTERQILKTEIGPSYVREKEGGETESFVALRVAESYEMDWTKTSKFWQSAEYLPDIQYGNNYLLNTEVGLRAAFDQTISLKFVLKHAFNSQPAEGKKKEDLSLESSLVFSF